MKNLKTLMFIFISATGLITSTKSIASSAKLTSSIIFFRQDSVITNRAIFCAEKITSSGPNIKSLDVLFLKVKGLDKASYVILYRNDDSLEWLLEEKPENFEKLLDRSQLKKISIGEGGLVVKGKKYPEKKYVIQVNP